MKGSTPLLVAKVTKNIRELFEFEQFDITSPQEGGGEFTVTINDHPHKLNAVGSGLAQFICTLFIAAIERPSFILIDEPETNLHLALQVKFLTILSEYCSEGIIFSTHSLALARSISSDIYTFRKKADYSRKEADYSEVKLLEDTKNFSAFLSQMGIDGYKDIGADMFLFVEGPTDVPVFDQFLKKLNINKKIIVLNLGGSSNINGQRGLELSELNRVNLNIAVLIDSEKNDEHAQLQRDRKVFVENCEKHGFKIHVTRYRSTENYFTDRAIKLAVGDQYSQLDNYEHFNKLESSRRWGKENNWKIAREMTKEDIEKTDIGEFLQSLRED